MQISYNSLGKPARTLLIFYNGASDRRPYEIGTTSLYKAHLLKIHANNLVYFLTSEIAKIVGPIVSLAQRFHRT